MLRVGIVETVKQNDLTTPESDHVGAYYFTYRQLAPATDGAHTLIRYRATMNAGRAVPGFVEDLLMRRSIRSLLENLRTEVNARFGRPDAD